MANMNTIKTVCVYCGSGPGTNPRFVEAATGLGKALAENGIRLVYGGGSIGLMGAVAKSVIDHGGSVTGIIPDFLTTRENALKRVHEAVIDAPENPLIDARRIHETVAHDPFALGQRRLDGAFDVIIASGGKQHRFCFRPERLRRAGTPLGHEARRRSDAVRRSEFVAGAHRGVTNRD